MILAKKITFLIIILFASAIASAQSGYPPPATQKLINAYPDFISGFANNQLIFKDGTKLTWDDGIKNKRWQQLLDHPDLKDMFLQEYPIGELKTAPAC